METLWRYVHCLAEVAGEALRADDLQAALPRMLALVGQAVDASRAYIFENRLDEAGRLRASLRYEWCAPGVEPQLGKADLEDVDYFESGFGRWAELLGRGRIIAGDVANLPAPEQPALLRQDIVSILVLPLFVEERWHGFIGFDACAGPRRWMPSEIDLLRAAGGIIAQAIERRRALQTLHMMQSAIERAAEAIYWVDSEARVLYTNAAGGRLLGRAGDALVGLRLSELSPDIDVESWLELWETAQHKGAVNLELRLRAGDGRVFPVEAACNYVAFEQQAYCLILAHDVTERRRQEQETRQAQRLQALGTLAGGIAHDFNNLLTGILGNLTLLELDVAPEQSAVLADVTRAAQRAAALTSQLLAFAGKSQVAMRPVDLNAVVREAAGLARETMDRRIDIELELSEEVRPIIADEGQVYQALLNLLINARDAISERLSGAAGPQPRDEHFFITVATRPAKLGEGRDGQFALLEVRDNGAGMSEEVRRRMFEPLFTTKTAGQGAGFGLATVHSIVEQHRGWIEVESEPGRGATFRLYFPLAQGELETPASSNNDECLSPVCGGSETILLAEDEEVVLNMGRRILERCGYRVLAARNGREAVELYRRHSAEIDLIVLDVSMPILSGGEVLEQVRGINPAVKLLLASGYAPEGNMAELLAAGAQGFIAKPYRARDLADAVRQALDAKGNDK